MKKPLLLAAFALPLFGCTTQTTSCVAAGSRVLTPDGWRAIETLSIGDIIYAVDETSGEQVETKIVAMQSATREVGLLAVEGAELRLTTDHPVYCPKEGIYAPAGDWFLGERTALAMLSDEGLATVEIERVETFVGIAEVFDITVDSELHNFVAEGILVHNKQSVVSCEYEGATVQERTACDCPNGESGGVRCDPAPHCHCSGDTNNGVADVGGMDVGGSDLGGSDMATEDAGGEDGGVADAGTDMGVDAGMSRARGTCVTDADCTDSVCISIPANSPDGYFTCQRGQPEAPNCGTAMFPDECCVHADCDGQGDNPTCVAGPIFYCGGAAAMEANVCMTDECATEADCGADQVCVPAGAFNEPVGRCVTTECRADSDCTAGTAGECRLFTNPCNNRFSGFFCTYDESECRSDADCTEGLSPYCSPGQEDGQTSCEQFFPPP